MRVAVFGQRGPYAPVALRHLLARQSGFEIALVVEGLRRRSACGTVHRRLPPIDGPLPMGDNLNRLARAGGVPVLETSDINAPAAIRVLAEHQLDWIVCVGFDRLFKPAVLETAKRGGINAHPSRLPYLRGPTPVFWALRQGDRELAVTLHQLDAREDHGPIYAQTPFVLPQRIAGDEIFHIAGTLAGTMLVKLLSRAARGPIHGRPQNHALATRAPRPKAEDARVDPLTWEAEHLVNFACGAAFFRAAWLRIGRDTFFVRRGLHAEPGRNLPAQYILSGSTLVVQCRDGVAHLEIQT